MAAPRHARGAAGVTPVLPQGCARRLVMPAEAQAGRAHCASPL